MNKTNWLQQRIMWNSGHWSLVIVLISVLLFFGGVVIIALPLAIASLVLGIRSKGAIPGLIASALSILIIIACAFFLTPLYHLVAR